jgi:hypothetical protein
VPATIGVEYAVETTVLRPLHCRAIDRAGYRVRTLTNSLNRLHLFEDRVEAHPFHFDRPELLKTSLEGPSVLYNTDPITTRQPNEIFPLGAREHAGIRGRRYKNEFPNGPGRS